MIGSDYSVDAEENSKDECLFKFTDFNADNFDDWPFGVWPLPSKAKFLKIERRFTLFRMDSR